MADIKIEFDRRTRISINGVDVSNSVYEESIELVRVGEEWGVRLTFAANSISTTDPVAVRLDESTTHGLGDVVRREIERVGNKGNVRG